MRHVIVLNVAGRGYTTFAGGVSTPFEAQPLGVATASVSEATVAVCNGLDQAARASPMRVSMAARRDRRGPTVVAVGLYLAGARDEKGREGLAFLHAVELGVGDDVAGAFLAIGACLPEARGRRLEEEVAQLASQTLDPSDFLRARASEVERRFPESDPSRRLPRSSISRIEHDLDGARAIAWAMFGLVCAGRQAPWQVEDRVEGGTVFTTMTPGGGGTERASALLFEGLRRAVQSRVAADSSDEPNTHPDPPRPAVSDGIDAPTVLTARPAVRTSDPAGRLSALPRSAATSRKPLITAVVGVLFGLGLASVPRLLVPSAAPAAATVAAAASEAPAQGDETSRGADLPDAGRSAAVTLPPPDVAAPAVILDASHPTAQPSPAPARVVRVRAPTTRPQVPPPDETPRPE